MTKKSFTLFEVLVSLIIVGVVLTLVLKIVNANDNIKIYYELQTIENYYNEIGTIKQSETIQFQLPVK